MLAFDMTARPIPFFRGAARPRSATLPEMLALAGAIRVASDGDTDEQGLVALAWAYRNRAARGARHRAETGHSHPEFGDGSLGLACRGAGGLPQFDDPLSCRAIAAACLVWAGDLTDPTAGATRFHRHEDLPDWAIRRKPVALIGPNFFYRDD